MGLAGGATPVKPRSIPGVIVALVLGECMALQPGSLAFLPSCQSPSPPLPARPDPNPNPGTRAGNAPRVSQDWGGKIIRPGGETREEVEGARKL